MGTFQMAILLCFNDRDQLKVKDIQEQTQLSGKELIKQIQSLVESKLVSTKSVDEEINEQSVVILNNEYSNKRTKFKITVAVQKDSPQVSILFKCLTFIITVSSLQGNRNNADISR